MSLHKESGKDPVAAVVRMFERKELSEGSEFDHERCQRRQEQCNRTRFYGKNDRGPRHLSQWLVPEEFCTQRLSLFFSDHLPTQNLNSMISTHSFHSCHTVGQLEPQSKEKQKVSEIQSSFRIRTVFGNSKTRAEKLNKIPGKHNSKTQHKRKSRPKFQRYVTPSLDSTFLQQHNIIPARSDLLLLHLDDQRALPVVHGRLCGQPTRRASVTIRNGSGVLRAPADGCRRSRPTTLAAT